MPLALPVPNSCTGEASGTHALSCDKMLEVLLAFIIVRLRDDTSYCCGARTTSCPGHPRIGHTILIAPKVGFRLALPASVECGTNCSTGDRSIDVFKTTRVIRRGCREHVHWHPHRRIFAADSEGYHFLGRI